MKNKLEIARDEINKIDEEMIKLFCQRMNCSKEVALYKKANNLPVLDASREEQIINKNLSILNNERLKDYYLTFFNGLLTASKDYQREILKDE